MHHAIILIPTPSIMQATHLFQKPYHALTTLISPCSKLIPK